MFTKNDLKTGMIVQTKDKSYWLVLRDHACDKRDMLVQIGYEHGIALNRYSNEMTLPGEDKFTIMKVSRPCVFPNLGSPQDEFSEARILYDRSKLVKKMTVVEICRELGYDVEIIKED